MTAAATDRRRHLRLPVAPQFAVSLLRPEGPLPAAYVNWSEGGMCVRLQETVEIRSAIRLQVITGRERPVQCAGRVAWVMQRLDLRGVPPFLFDVGVEFIKPPPALRQWLAQRAGGAPPPARRPARGNRLGAGARRLIPHRGREPGHPVPWHLIVSVDSLPCFSGHYPSQRDATDAWSAFQRQQAKGSAKK